MLWVIVPEVALMVTGVDPMGVKGTALLVLEQPAISPAERTKTAKRAKSRMLSWRGREKVRIAAKGRRRAAVIAEAAAPLRVDGERDALFFTVEMVTVLGAGAPEVTVSCAGEKEHLAARGKLLQARVTVPLKLLVGTALTISGTEEPSVTVMAGAEALKPKVAAPVAVGLVLTAARRPCFSPVRPAAK